MKFTTEQIERSIISGNLALDPADQIALLKLGTGGILLYVLPAVAVFLYLDARFSFPVLASTFLGVLILVFFTIIKFRDLRLVSIKTALSEKDFRDLIVKFASTKDWKIVNNRKSLVILKTGFGRTLTAERERITILNTDGHFWACSICDPERRFSWTSIWRNNNDNIKLVKRILSGSVAPAKHNSF